MVSWALSAARGLSLVAESGATLHRGVWASHQSGLSYREHRLWNSGSVVGCMNLAAPLHVQSSWTIHRTHVPCIGRQILIHCSTRKVWYLSLLSLPNTITLLDASCEEFTAAYSQFLPYLLYCCPEL